MDNRASLARMTAGKCMNPDPERAAKAAIVRAWTRGAAAYDHDVDHGLATPAVQRAWTAALQESLGAGSFELLDVGTGTGLLAVLAAQLGHCVTGIDFTAAMLKHARQRAAQANIHVEWREADAAALPFVDSSFDAIISRHVVWTMTDPQSAFREWIRVVRPGGRIIWLDGLQPGTTRHAVRQRAAKLIRRLQRDSDHHSDHSYPPEAIAALPLHELRTTAPLSALLREFGVTDISFRFLPEVARAELEGQSLVKRLAGSKPRYAGMFVVNAALKEQGAR